MARTTCPRQRGYGNTPLELHLMTRGPEAGFFVTNSVSQRFGGEGDLGIEFGVHRYNGKVSEMTRKSVEGHYLDLEAGVLVGGSIYVCPSPNNLVSWYGGSMGIGMTFGISAGWGITREGFNQFPDLY